MRDVLIELFEREFVESQEALGMTLVGQFRDLDNPDRFVWLRGFADMTTRARALQDFYGGPVWKDASRGGQRDDDRLRQRPALAPARSVSGFSLENVERQAPGARENPRGLVMATTYHLKDGAEHDVVDFFEQAIQLEMTRVGASIAAYFVTENHPNTFPALPVREGANVLVWFSVFADEMAYERHAAARADSIHWKNKIAGELTARLKERPEILRLLPTPRSRLHA